MIRALATALPLDAAGRFNAVELARQAVVLGCAAALVLAGPVLPF